MEEKSIGYQESYTVQCFFPRVRSAARMRYDFLVPDENRNATAEPAVVFNKVLARLKLNLLCLYFLTIAFLL